MLSQEFINQIEEIVASGIFSVPGVTPCFNVRALDDAKPAYKVVRDAPVHSEEGFAFMGLRGYAFFKASDNNIYVIERYMGKLDRVFLVEDLFGRL
jgi:hypothetical protein